MEETREYKDIGYIVTMTTEDDCRVKFKVSKLGNFDMQSIELYLSGSIKCDGCSNMRFDRQDSAMLHFCSKKEAADIGVLMNRLYELAAGMLPGSEDFFE